MESQNSVTDKKQKIIKYRPPLSSLKLEENEQLTALQKLFVNQGYVNHFTNILFVLFASDPLLIYKCRLVELCSNALNTHC